MLRFQDLRFRTKFTLLIGTVLVGLAIFGFYVADTLSQVEINGKLYDGISMSSQINGDFAPASEYILLNHLDAYRMAVTSDPALRQKFMAEFEHARSAFKTRHQYWVEHAPRTAMGQAMVKDAGQPAEDYFNVYDTQFLPAVRRGDTKTAVSLAEGQMQTDFEQNQAAAAAVKQQSEAQQQALEQQADALVTSRGRMLMLVGLLVAGAVLLLGILMMRSVVGAMDESVAVLSAVAAGDLTRRLNLNSADELGQMAASLNQAVESMHATVVSLAQGAQSIASASEEISANASQTAQGADTQKDQSTQVATAMQEMSATVQEVASNAHNAAEAARQATDTARRGGVVVGEAVERMRAIAETVKTTAQTVGELGKSSSQIGTIVEVIDDIADQTNLLALNAAIEAARAGDQGRGFAVVADEVRKLAERTTAATKEIAQMIGVMQKETNKAVSAMDTGNRKVEEGVTTAGQAGEALREILRNIDRLGEMVSQIAAASSQQSAATDQVNSSMEQIALVSSEAASGAQQAARACQDLSHLALDMQNLVARFQVAGAR